MLNFDIINFIKSSNAISEEINFQKLVETLLKIVVENAGAERGVLILEKETHLEVEAEWTLKDENINFINSDLDENNYLLPLSVIKYVGKTKEDVVLENACNKEGIFINDPYIIENICRSILCVPVINQGKLTGIIYLENNLTSGVFSPERHNIIKLLSSDIAISLENSFLYSKVEDYNITLEQKVEKRSNQLKEKNTELQKIATFLNELTSNLSHDLKAPLNSCYSIMKVFDLITENRNSIDKELISNTLGKIDKSLKKINDYISLCLDREMLSVGKLVLKNEFVYIKESFKDTVFMYSEILERKNINFNYEMPEEELIISGDKIRFELVLSNLIGNAIKHAQSILKVNFTKKGANLLIEVFNDGMEIKEEIKNKIFDRFVTDTQTSIGGTGLGLYICKQYINLMRGEIWFESNLNKGTTFFINIPLSKVFLPITPDFLHGC